MNKIVRMFLVLIVSLISLVLEAETVSLSDEDLYANQLVEFINKSKHSLDEFYEQRHLLVKTMRADDFCRKILQLAGDNQQYGIEKTLQLLDFMEITYGLDFYYNIDSAESRGVASDDKILQKLKRFKNVKCTPKVFEEMKEAGIGFMIFTPEYFCEQRYKNLGAQEAEVAKIPYFIHHIWLTTSDNPREIRSQDIQNVLATKKVFERSKANWTHIVWSNDLTLIPESIKILNKAGIEVRSIYDYTENIQLLSLIEDLISKKDWGKATDTLRYSLVNYFGGVYADLNYIFNRDTTSENHKYNFFSALDGCYYIENFFFGASPGHPVIQKILKLVARNLTNPPLYLAYIPEKSTHRTDLATANPTYLAYYAEANKNGNVDVIYPNAEYYSYSEEYQNTLRAEYDKFKGSSGNLLVSKQKNPLCLDYKLFALFRCKDICGTPDQYIGYDSEDGGTWH